MFVMRVKEKEAELKEAEKEVSRLSCVQGRHRGNKHLIHVLYQRGGLSAWYEE